MPMQLEYEVIPSDSDGVDAIRITGGRFKGVVFAFGRVQFGRDKNGLTMRFEQEIIDGREIAEADPDDFRDYCGDILVEQIEEGVKDNSITYTGGS